MHTTIDNSLIRTGAKVLVHRSLDHLFIHQLPESHLRVAVLLEAEVAALNKAAAHRFFSEYLFRQFPAHHNSAMPWGGNGINAGAERFTFLDIAPRGIERGLRHNSVLPLILQALHLLLRPRHQILLRGKQVAEIVAPIVVRPVTAFPGDKLLGRCQMNAQHKFAVAHMTGIRNDISGVFSVIHHRSRSFVVFFLACSCWIAVRPCLAQPGRSSGCIVPSTSMRS